MLLYDVGIGGGCKGAFLNRQVFTQYVKMHLFENDEGIGWKKGAKGGKNEGVI